MFQSQNSPYGAVFYIVTNGLGNNLHPFKVTLQKQFRVVIWSFVAYCCIGRDIPHVNPPPNTAIFEPDVFIKRVPE